MLNHRLWGNGGREGLRRGGSKWSSDGKESEDGKGGREKWKSEKRASSSRVGRGKGVVPVH
jgi:hypothetical protein